MTFNPDDPFVTRFMKGLPPEVQEYLYDLLQQRADQDPTIPWEDNLKIAVDKVPLVREATYELIESGDYGREALAFALRLSAFVFSGTADPSIKALGWLPALNFIAHYIRTHVTADPPVQAMINLLIIEIENTSEGRDTAILTPNKRRGRPAASKQNDILFAIASVIIDRRVEAGDSEEHAARQIVRVFDERGWPLPPSTRQSNMSAENRLLNWRSRVRVQTRRPSYARLIYDDVKERVRSQTPEKAMASLIHLLNLASTKVR